jgi:recombination protein RecA
VLDLALSGGILEQSGSWFSFQGEKLGQGREIVRDLLAGNPELMQRILDALGSQRPEVQA